MATIAHAGFTYFEMCSKIYSASLFADRSKEKIDIIEAYLRATKQFRDYNNPEQDPIFSEVRRIGEK